MSILAMKRVCATDIQPAGRKLVALKLADHCNDIGGSLFVGMAAIARDCGVSRSQAQRHVHALVDAGLLSVTANATGGARGTVPHYRLHVERLAEFSAGGSVDATRSTDATGRTDAANGQHACGGRVAPMRTTGSTYATQTTINHQLTTKEPILGERRKLAPIPVPDWMPRDAWENFVAMRKGMKSIPFSNVARALLIKKINELRAQGHDAEALLNEAIVNGWRTVYAPKSGSTAYVKPTASKHAGFENLNYREGINRDGSFS